MLLAQQNFGDLDERGVAQRIEAKYLVSEYQAAAIRDYIQPYMRPDPYGVEYPVNSLYLDSPNLRMYTSSAMGEKNRHKLRIRWYEDDPHRPVTFEIKQRINQILKKQRAVVDRRHAPRILAGGLISSDMLAKRTTDAMDNLYHFRDLMESMAASPRVAVRYMREAYVSSLEEPIRVTFDRRIECMPCDTFHPEGGVDGIWTALDAFPVVLEIKFTDTYPSWVKQLICRYHLLRDSVAKYVVCVDALERIGHTIAGRSRGALQWSI